MAQQITHTTVDQQAPKSEQIVWPQGFNLFQSPDHTAFSRGTSGSLHANLSLLSWACLIWVTFHIPLKNNSPVPPMHSKDPQNENHGSIQFNLLALSSNPVVGHQTRTLGEVSPFLCWQKLLLGKITLNHLFFPIRNQWQLSQDNNSNGIRYQIKSGCCYYLCMNKWDAETTVLPWQYKALEFSFFFWNLLAVVHGWFVRDRLLNYKCTPQGSFSK